MGRNVRTGSIPVRSTTNAEDLGIKTEIMGLLTGKTALITGAARGIGREIAIKFAAEGADVAFTVRKQSETEEKTFADVSSYGTKVRMYVADASDYEAAGRVVSDVLADFGRIDVLVNNAGITSDTMLLRMSEEQWDKVIGVNLKSAFNYIHAVLQPMMRQRGGSIISLSSVVGEAGNAGQANYAASKAGIIALSKSVAKEMGSRGIRVNCIAPGYIISDMTAAIPENLREEWVKTIPMRRGGTPEEVAKAALFLASDLSSYVSGQVLNVCGGMHC